MCAYVCVYMCMCTANFVHMQCNDCAFNCQPLLNNQRFYRQIIIIVMMYSPRQTNEGNNYMIIFTVVHLTTLWSCNYCNA